MAKTTYQIITEITGQQKVQSELGKLGLAAGVTGAALLGISKSALDAANNVNRSFANTATLFDDPIRQTEELKANLEDLSGELGNTASMADLAAGSYDVVSAGFADAAEATDVLRASQKLALVGQGSLASASDGVTTAINALSSTFDENATVQEKATKVSGVFAETIRLGKTDIDQLGPAIARVAPLANNLGVNVETLGASFATMTANGVKTTEASTGLQAVLRGLSVQSEQSVNMQKQLGISFDENTVKQDGLAATLRTLMEATGGSTNELFKLLGSTEAVNAVLSLSKDNFESFDKSLAAVGDTSVTTGKKLDGTYDKLADSRAVKAERALNKLSDTMVKLGEGVAIAVEPAIDALSFLMDNFNALPEPLQKAIGLLTAVTGAGLTLGAAIIGLSAAMTALGGAMGTVGASAIALKSALAANAAATVAATGATGGFTVALGTVSLAVAPVVLALGALAAAYIQLDNVTKKNKALESLADITNTDNIVNEMENLVKRMKETGEAIPEKEMQIYRDAVKELGTENNQLADILGIVERKNKEAANGTINGTKATDSATKANIANAESEEDRAEAIKEYISESEKAIDAVSRRQSVEVAALEERLRTEGKSELEVIEAKSKANQRYFSEIAQMRREQLDSSKIEGEAREDIELKLVEITTQAQTDIRNSRKAAADERKRQTQEAEAEAKKAADTEKKAIQEAKRLRSEATKEAISNAKVVTQTITAGVEQAAASVKSAKSLLSGNQSFLSSSKSLLGDIAKSAQDANVSEKTKNKLLGISKELMADLQGLGFNINGNLKTEEGLRKINAQLEQAELSTKLQSIELQRQEIALETQLQTLAIEGAAEEASIKLANADLSDSERKQLELQIKLGSKRLDILRQQEAVAQRNLGLQEKSLRAEANIKAAIANESLSSGNQVQSATSTAGTASTASTSPSSASVEISVEGVTQAVDNTTLSVDGVKQSIDGQAQTFENVRATMEQASVDLSNIRENVLVNANNIVALTEINNAILSEAQFHSAILNDLRTDVQEVRNTSVQNTNAISGAIARLPSQIAASIPRPSND